MRSESNVGSKKQSREFNDQMHPLFVQLRDAEARAKKGDAAAEAEAEELMAGIARGYQPKVEEIVRQFPGYEEEARDAAWDLVLWEISVYDPNGQMYLSEYVGAGRVRAKLQSKSSQQSAFEGKQRTSAPDPVWRRLVDSSSPEGEMRWAAVCQAIETEIRTLSERRRHVLQLRGYENLTYEQIGNQLGVTTERARQIEAQALRRLFDRYRTMSEVLELVDAAVQSSFSVWDQWTALREIVYAVLASKRT